MTVGAHQRLADLNFDPLEWSVKIARGEALTTNHPFLEMIRDWYMDMISHLTKGNAINWERELEKILEKAKVSLTDSWVPLNLRSDHIKELMQYLYPKLKAVEHSGSIQQDIRIKPLSRNEVEIFKEVFDEEY
jgi:integrase